VRAHRALLVAGLPVLAGCVYFNALYNARSRFEAGEAARLAGRPDEASAAYADAVTKAARSYRQDPEGRWADDALLVLGRAHLRRGELAAARAALDEAHRVADDERVRDAAGLYLGATLILTGESSRGLALLNDAIRTLRPGPLRGEGHYWRARLLLSRGQVDQGWWDLDRAAEEDPRLAVPASLERLSWGVLTDDPVRAATGAHALLASARGADRADSLEASVARAVRRWGAAPAAALLAPARDGPWPPGPRDRILLARARWLVEAGDTAAARSEAEWVADGTGDEALEARLFLADLRLGAARGLGDLAAARTVLLPASGHPRVAELAEDLRTVELLTGWGGAVPGALFAAAELARDRLDAPGLARRLFLRHVDTDPEGPWTGKALLAALALEPDQDAALELRARLTARNTDPYVRAAMAYGRPAAGPEVAELDDRLRARLAEVVERARAEARRRDVRLRGDTVSSPHPSRERP
jgi:predicted negative regulator of RcsB-dependent stress response